ncbi:hypothetical protein LTS18_015008, partial [Coniosporium uncinatum]
MFEEDHGDELRQLSTVKLLEHVEASTAAKNYKNNKYRLTITNMTWTMLIQFLESQEENGGSVITQLLSRHFNIIAVDRAAAGFERSLEAMIARGGRDDDLPAEDEGIPGHIPGSANTNPNAPAVLARLNLGQLPMDKDAADDVRAELLDEDLRNPPAPGQNSLVEEFDRQIKTEPDEDGPAREAVPLPPPLARDVAMEVQKIRENRDRFKMESTTGGVGPGVSVVMYTFHNTYDSINCIDFSGDYTLVAAGMAESYIRVWSLEGKPLPSLLQPTPSDPDPKPSSSRRLIGHSGPVYGVSFSPSTPKPNDNSPTTTPRYLLSCSADKTIRLWSLEVWECLVAYRSHDSPVWDISWGPY